MRWSRLAMGFCPQFRSGRRLYAQETTGALLAGLFLWLMINPIADAEFISDEMLTWIGRFVYPLLINLILIFMTVSAARRLHDAGHSGAWALFVMCPGANIFLMLYLLLRPGVSRPTGLPSAAGSENMALAVKKDMLVTLSVRMADMSGKILEESGPEGLTYLHGHGDIFPKLEAALEGRFPGEGFFIKLEPEDAFGEYDPDSLVMVPVERLGNPETVVRGLVFEGVPGEANDGRRWHVTDIADGMAVLETNHPLAGMALQFEVKVMEVAEPSDEDAVGDDNVVVPGFLSIADRIVSEDEEDESDETMDRMLEEHAHPDDSAMARMASAAPRIIR